MFIAGLTLSRSPFPLRRHHSEQLFAAEGKRVRRSLPNSVQRYCWPPPRARFTSSRLLWGTQGWYVRCTTRTFVSMYSIVAYILESRACIRSRGHRTALQQLRQTSN